jgi:hypothetical protein
VTAHQVVGIIPGGVCEVIFPSQYSIKDTGNKRDGILRENKPISGSFSLLNKFVHSGKPCKTVLFSSCGEYAK